MRAGVAWEVASGEQRDSGGVTWGAARRARRDRRTARCGPARGGQRRRAASGPERHPRRDTDDRAVARPKRRPLICLDCTARTPGLLSKRAKVRRDAAAGAAATTGAGLASGATAATFEGRTWWHWLSRIAAIGLWIGHVSLTAEKREAVTAPAPRPARPDVAFCLCGGWGPGSWARSGRCFAKQGCHRAVPWHRPWLRRRRATAPFHASQRVRMCPARRRRASGY